MLFSAFWFTFFFVDLFEWIGKKDYVMWVEFVIYFCLGKTTHFNLRGDEWDDVQKAYQIIFFFGVWFMLETFQEIMFYVQNLRGKWK